MRFFLSLVVLVSLLGNVQSWGIGAGPDLSKYWPIWRSHLDLSFTYASVSWKQLSVDSSSAKANYQISYCGAYSYKPEPAPFDIGTLVGTAPMFWMHSGDIIITSADGASQQKPQTDCTVTQADTSTSTYMCCGSLTVSLSTSVGQNVVFQDESPAQNSITSYIPANPTVTASPHFVDVVANGLFNLHQTTQVQNLGRLPVAPYSAPDRLSYTISSIPTNVFAIDSTASVTAQVPAGLSVGFTDFVKVSIADGDVSSQVLLKYDIIAN